MAEYIDRDLAIHCSIYGFAQDETWPCAPDEAQAAIAALPAEKVREDVRGEWMEPEWYGLVEFMGCTNCGEAAPVGRFCSNCGARMKGGK